MGRRKKQVVGSVSSARLQWLRKALLEAGQDCAKARAAKSWSAVAALHRQRQSLRAEYDIESERIRKAMEKPADDPRDLTPEEMEARETARAGALETVHLQIYVAEYLARTPTLHLVTTDGTPIAILRPTG